jgi:hypothetical protein
MHHHTYSVHVCPCCFVPLLLLQVHNSGGKAGMHGNLTSLALGAAAAKSFQPNPKPSPEGVWRSGDNNTFVPATTAVFPRVGRFL